MTITKYKNLALFYHNLSATKRNKQENAYVTIDVKAKMTLKEVTLPRRRKF